MGDGALVHETCKLCMAAPPVAELFLQFAATNEQNLYVILTVRLRRCDQILRPFVGRHLPAKAHHKVSWPQSVLGSQCEALLCAETFNRLLKAAQIHRDR